jgi:hypothetical protein
MLADRGGGASLGGDRLSRRGIPQRASTNPKISMKIGLVETDMAMGELQAVF